MNKVRNEDLYWRHDLTAVNSFITRENINQTFKEYGFTGKIGILSIDIDGNDYWIWECIESVDPEIVIVEYNSVFGAEHPISIPYDPSFMRNNAHYSNLYWGTSLAALDYLSKKKNYQLIGTNDAGNNAYFIKREKLGNLPAPTTKEAFTQSKFRESRNEQGRLTYISGDERLKVIENMEVINVVNKELVKIKDL